MHIDAHQHFWRYSTTEYGWISDTMSGLQRDFLPEDLSTLLDPAGVDASIAVQARQSEEETRWLLDLAARHKRICGVVGWVDLCAGDLDARLASYAGSPWLKGFRHVLQDEKDERFMMRSAFLEGVNRLAAAGYSYDILVYSKQLPLVVEFIEALPPMRLVIDHIGKPAIRNGEWQPWADNLEAVARFPHVHCKLSGLVTEATWSQWRSETLLRYLEHVLRIFGPKRVMFGSDWPVCTLAASYREVHGLIDRYVRDVAAEHLTDILGGNAAKFYAVPTTGI